jgi:predicted anti-sigma-YlaC factor YlaD
MILISKKSGQRPLFDRVPERHDREYTKPVAMSTRIAATPSASLALMREARSVFACIGFAITAMVLLVLGGAIGTVPAMADVSSETHPFSHPLGPLVSLAISAIGLPLSIVFFGV